MIKVKEYRIVHINQLLSWHITKNKSNNHPEEEVFDIHRILCGSDLPPIKTNDISYLKKKVSYIQQAVQLTGLGNPMFMKAMENIAEIHGAMAKHIGDSMLSPWQNSIYEGCNTIDANAIYFSLRKFIPNEHGQAFGKGIDPDRVLVCLRDQHLIHGYDNKVEYLKEEKDDDGNTRTVRTKPENFKIGDIICASISFVSFPTKSNNVSMTIILQVLMFIKSITTIHKLNRNVNNSSMITMNKANIIKYKIIIDDSNNDVCKRIKNINIDNTMDTSEGE